MRKLHLKLVSHNRNPSLISPQMQRLYSLKALNKTDSELTEREHLTLLKAECNQYLRHLVKANKNTIMAREDYKPKCDALEFYGIYTRQIIRSFHQLGREYLHFWPHFTPYLQILENAIDQPETPISHLVSVTSRLIGEIECLLFHVIQEKSFNNLSEIERTILIFERLEETTLSVSRGYSSRWDKTAVEDFLSIPLLELPTDTDMYTHTLLTFTLKRWEDIFPVVASYRHLLEKSENYLNIPEGFLEHHSKVAQTQIGDLAESFIETLITFYDVL